MVLAARWLRRTATDLYWSVRGPLLNLPEIPMHAQSVLFVCKGNICRSPFAEQLAVKMYGARMRFGSAGLHVAKSVPAPDDAIQAAQRFGIDLESHRSQAISAALVGSYDMIVAMEAWQYAELLTRFECDRSKMFLLPLMTGEPPGSRSGFAAFNIQDPFGGPPSLFDESFTRIDQCLAGLFEKIKVRSGIVAV